MLKRFAAVLLAAILLFSLSMTAFAHVGFTDDGGITIGDHEISTDVDDATETVVVEVKRVLQFIVGLCAMISFTAFVYQISKLIIYSGNEQGRAKAIRAIVFAFVAIALFGGIEFCISIFWNLGS